MIRFIFSYKVLSYLITTVWLFPKITLSPFFGDDDDDWEEE